MESTKRTDIERERGRERREREGGRREGMEKERGGSRERGIIIIHESSLLLYFLLPDNE